MAEFLQLFVSGLATGAIYALVAVGFTLVWQTSQTINFAQGDFAMLPAVLVLMALNGLGLGMVRAGALGVPIPPWAAFLLASILFLLMFGVGLKLMVVDPMLKHGVLPLAIATMALSILMREGAKEAFSAEGQRFPSLAPEGEAGNVSILGAVVSLQDILVFAVAVAAIALLQLFITRTRTGRQMQATAQNPDVAKILGVPVQRMVMLTFIINAGLAIIASYLISPIYLVKFSNGDVIGLAAFNAAIIGGFNQIRGAIAGGLIIGVIDNFAARYISTSYRAAFPLILLALVILLKPEGLLGRKEERKV
jgi:branched-chain amino acid transport system permease protein